MSLNLQPGATAVRLGILEAWAKEQPEWAVKVTFIRHGGDSEEEFSLWAREALELAKSIAASGGLLVAVKHVREDDRQPPLESQILAAITSKGEMWLDPEDAEELTAAVMRVLRDRNVEPPF